MSLGVVTEHRAWGVYFNASRGAATNGLMGIFSKTHGIASVWAGKARSLWELTCLRWPQLGLAERPHRLHRRQASSHMGSSVHSDPNESAGACEDVLQRFLHFGHVCRSGAVGDLQLVLAAQGIGIAGRQFDQ